MALDFTTINRNIDVPFHLDFTPVFEPSRMADHKFVINPITGEAMGHVGEGFKCASHGDFFKGVWDQVTENLQGDDIAGAEVRFKSGRKGGFALMDVQFPSISTEIETSTGHKTSIRQRIIALHGVDGKAGSNTTLFGNIDMFCTNGCISGEYSKVRRRNSSRFSLEAFINELRRAKNDFYAESDKLKVFAQTSMQETTVKSLLEDIISSKDKQEKMFELYMQEAEVRGHNKFSLMSAFTNYASHTLGNGFELRQTANRSETEAITMMNREVEVNQWMSDPRFLEAA
jgi:hypothetical protein